MGFLENNAAWLQQIDSDYAKLGALAEQKPTQAATWRVHFDCVWRELCAQVNWAPALSRKRQIVQRLGAWFGIRVWDAPRRIFPAHSPVFSVPGLAFTFPPAIAAYPTVFGFTFCSTGDDMWEALATGHYTTELSETWLTLKLVTAITSFVDVGANIGFYSLLVAQASAADTRIWACEPAPKNLATLRRAVELNHFQDKIQILPLALSDQPGPSDFWLCPGGSGGHSLLPTEPNAHKITVQVDTLDRLWRAHAPWLTRSFVKIDVEGAEPRVIAGGQAWLTSESAPILLLEAWHHSTPTAHSEDYRAVIRQLRAWGYHVFAIQSPQQDQVILQRITSDAFKPAPIGDYLALPAWAWSREPELAQPFDLRLFSDPAQLAALAQFLRASLAQLEQLGDA